VPQTPTTTPLSLLRHWFPIASGVLSTALLAIASVSPHAHFEIGHHSYAWSSHLLIMGIFFAVLAAFATGRRQLVLDRLRTHARSVERAARAGEQGILHLVFRELQTLRAAAHHYSNERASLFRWEGDHFILLGRCSLGPVYQASMGRGTYALCQDCLGTAWLGGRDQETSLPPAGAAPPWSDEWIGRQCARGIPESVARALKMPSRSYFAFRINTAERALGVLVFESVNTPHEAGQTATDTVLDLDRLDRIQRRSSDRLAQLLRESRFIDEARVAELLPDIPIG